MRKKPTKETDDKFPFREYQKKRTPKVNCSLTSISRSAVQRGTRSHTWPLQTPRKESPPERTADAVETPPETLRAVRPA